MSHRSEKLNQPGGGQSQSMPRKETLILGFPGAIGKGRQGQNRRKVNSSKVRKRRGQGVNRKKAQSIACGGIAECNFRCCVVSVVSSWPA